MNRKAVAAQKKGSNIKPLLLGTVGGFVGAAAGAMFTLYASDISSVSEQLDQNTMMLTHIQQAQLTASSTKVTNNDDLSTAIAEGISAHYQNQQRAMREEKFAAYSLGSAIV